MKTRIINKRFKLAFAMSIILIVPIIMSSYSCTEDENDNNNPGTIEDNTFDGNYTIINTYQTTFYGNDGIISEPNPGDEFYGQDAHFSGNQSNFIDNGNGTVTDLTTGLMWQQNLPDYKYDYENCVNYADTCTLGGFTDWRLPSIKELYSLIRFDGATGLDEESCIPYINTEVFEFRFGTEFGERYIDAQYASTAIYKGTTMGGNETMFGVNFADGRIKGYPTSKTFEIKLVRGNVNYGINDLVDNADGTINDNNTDLMWDKEGSSKAMLWQDALVYAQQMNEQNYLGYNDWRVPNAKELQSIIDYTRSPSYTSSAAISELFMVPEITNEGGKIDYPWYWTATTHDDGIQPDRGIYVCFGRALGYWQNEWQDVHGAGAQRSDPKTGDPNDFPEGHGPQGDAIRIYNYVRLVRDI